MTENLAARGEGLAGLREMSEKADDGVWSLDNRDSLGRAILWATPNVRFAIAAANYVRELLEAAAPPSTPRNRSYLEDLKHDLRDESYAYEYLLACAQDSTEALRIGVRDVLAALATPSPQAPGTHQCHSLSACRCCYGTLAAHSLVTNHCQFCERAAATQEHSEFKGLSIEVSHGAPPGVAMPPWKAGDEVLIRGTVKRIEASGAPVIVIPDRREAMGNWTFQPRDIQPAGSGARTLNAGDRVLIEGTVNCYYVSDGCYGVKLAPGQNVAVPAKHVLPAGSPRKVGEDGALTETQVEDIHKIIERHSTDVLDYELATDDINAYLLRSSSVPVGEPRGYTALDGRPPIDEHGHEEL